MYIFKDLLDEIIQNYENKEMIIKKFNINKKKWVLKWTKEVKKLNKEEIIELRKEI